MEKPVQTPIHENRSPSNRNSGFTLIEVLIALIIMSVGMLGIAGLYVHSMKAGSTSLFRHHAVTLAGDVADRIRANPRAGAAYALAGANNNCVGQLHAGRNGRQRYFFVGSTGGDFIAERGSEHRLRQRRRSTHLPDNDHLDTAW